MTRQFVFAAVIGLSSLWGCESVFAEEPMGKLIFKDDFNRNDSQEEKDEVGNGWTTSSETTAGGHKQVDLRDGAMYVVMHKTANHSVSVRHDFEFRNGIVQLKLMLTDPKDVLVINFADMQLKTVHAGHLFRVNISPSRVDIVDQKTGTMQNEIYHARVAKQVTEEMQKLVASKTKGFRSKLSLNEWHDVEVRIEDETLHVKIDDRPVGQFSSEGMAHQTKRLLRLLVPREAVIDDVKIYSLD